MNADLITHPHAAVPGITRVTVPVPVDLLHNLLLAATVDDKTGALTSRAWSARATALLEQPPGRPAWTLLLIDLDRFATLNATHGHPAADHVLTRITGAVRQVLPDAVIGRFGGDEFVVLVPGDSHHAGRDAAHAVHQTIAALDIVVDRPDGPIRITGVTASVGVAVQPALRRTDLGELLWAADRALYTAKRSGGDTVRFSTPDLNAPDLNAPG